VGAVAVLVQQVDVDEFVPDGRCHRGPAAPLEVTPREHDHLRLVVAVADLSGPTLRAPADLPVEAPHVGRETERIDHLASVQFAGGEELRLGGIRIDGVVRRVDSGVTVVRRRTLGRVGGRVVTRRHSAK
jgi:hypothetical protein